MTRRSDRPALNLVGIVSMIDFLLILLFLMLARERADRESDTVQLEPPRLDDPTTGAAAPRTGPTFRVQVRANGRLAADGVPVTAAAELEALARAARVANPRVSAVLECDGAAAFEKVLPVQVVLGRAGFATIQTTYVPTTR